MEKKIIFVGGCPRSGTTLVQNILDSHKNITGMSEFHILPQLMSIRNRMSEYVNDNMYTGFGDRKYIDVKIKEFINAFINNYPEKENNKYISEKTPSNILVFKELAEIFQDAKFIFVIRDPRAIVSSLLEVGKRKRKMGQKVEEYLSDINESVRFVKLHLQKGVEFSKHYKELLVIVYEELVTEPERVTKNMCEYLNVEWDQKMINPKNINHLAENCITSDKNKAWYTKEEFYRNPDTESLDKWREKLTDYEQAVVDIEFEEMSELCTFGYEFNRNIAQKYMTIIEKKVRNQLKL